MEGDVVGDSAYVGEMVDIVRNDGEIGGVIDDDDVEDDDFTMSAFLDPMEIDKLLASSACDGVVGAPCSLGELEEGGVNTTTSNSTTTATNANANNSSQGVGGVGGVGGRSDVDGQEGRGGVASTLATGVMGALCLVGVVMNSGTPVRREHCFLRFCCSCGPWCVVASIFIWLDVNDLITSHYSGVWRGPPPPSPKVATRYA